VIRPATENLTQTHHKMNLKAIGFAFATILMACNQSPELSSSKKLHELFDKEWDFRIHEFPLEATFAGDTTQNDRIESLKPEDIRRREDFYAALLQDADHIGKTSLDREDLVNLSLFKFYVNGQVDYYRFKDYRIPILSDEGFHTMFAQIPTITPFTTKRDYESYIARLKAFPAYVDQNIYWMRQGLSDGFTLPRVVLSGYEITIQSLIVDDVTTSVFFKPFLKFPEGFAETTKKELTEDGEDAILGSVMEGYKTFLHFMEGEYIPGCRETISASALPGGDAYYRSKVKYFTTTEMSVDEIHDLGLREVDRIGRDMDELIRKTGFKGDRRAFINFLRTDPRFYPKTAESLLKEASFIAKKMDAKLPSLFGKLPRQPYGVAPVPDHLAPKYTSGRYVGAPIDGTEPGYYWVNTYNLPSRTLYTLESLTLHEAVPGHHLQIALTQELTNLPKFRQQLYIDAFGEGWGLYAEWLGIEAGFYQDPYSDFGRLTYEMWRACRLVVDTGIHAKGWTRQQVIDYLADNTALSIHECTTETDRYISWPGQALAYKIGELKIKEMRSKAVRELDQKFDIREFHDLVLSQGTVTMPILESMVNDYIEQKK
jgi:uncharacterized protein (DUF885 family)